MTGTECKLHKESFLTYHPVFISYIIGLLKRVGYIFIGLRSEEQATLPQDKEVVIVKEACFKLPSCINTFT